MLHRLCTFATALPFMMTYFSSFSIVAEIKSAHSLCVWKTLVVAEFPGFGIAFARLAGMIAVLADDAPWVHGCARSLSGSGVAS